MIYGQELPGCCGVLELQDFYRKDTTEKLVEALKKAIIQDCEDRWDYDYYRKPHYHYKTTDFFIATTNEDQKYMEEPLRALGFKSRSFNSRHEGKVLFWTRRGLPPDVKKEWRAWVKEMLTERKGIL